MEQTRLVIVDDSRIFRSIAEECMKSVPNVNVVGSLWSGEKVLEFIKDHEVDLITLDVEMPGLDGLETLRRIQEYNSETGKSIGVIMLSGLTRRGATATIEALELGAFDFIAKPAVEQGNALELLKKELAVKINGWQKRGTGAGGKRTSGDIEPKSLTKEKRDVSKPVVSGGPFDMICIGVSTGGPKALTQILPELCRSISCPVFIVQHMPPGFTESLADGLNKRCSNYTVREAEDDGLVKQNEIYIAPGGFHLVVKEQKNRLTTVVNQLPPENGCRPSVDVLFRSVAQVGRGKRVLAMVLTGMGNDGAAGIRPLKRSGAVLLAQDEQSCVVFGMPKCAIDTGLVDQVVPLQKIPHTVSVMQRSR